MNEENKTICFSHNDNVIIVVHEDCPESGLCELGDLSTDGGEVFFHLPGTDAWGEWEETDSQKHLVFKSYDDKIYCRCRITDEILQKLEREGGFLLIITETPITVDELEENFGESCEPEEIEEWIRKKEIENGLTEGAIEALICCYKKRQEEQEE